MGERKKHVGKQKQFNKRISAKSTPAISRKKIWFFRLISLVLVPVLFFCLLELGLRIFDYGYSPNAIVKYKLDGKEIYCHNYKFGWRFFPHSISRHFDGFAFDIQKSPKTYRIFVLGASAAAGIPAPAYNFGHLLEVMLDEMYPDMDFEVLTLAMPAINSYAVLEIAKECTRYQPDLFIVYLGNNEVVGPYGPGTVFTPLSPSLTMIRANIALKATRTGQLVEQVMQSIKPRSGTPREWGGLEMFLNEQVRHDDPRLEIAYQHFEKNLSDICQAGLNAGASVIVSNVGSNLKDCPPFASLHRPDLTDAEEQTWQEIYQQGVALQTEGQFEQAITKYLEAEKTDGTFADLQFRLGECYWNIGDYQKAKDKYIKAREYDTLRFRADNRINEIIRTVTDSLQDNALYFVDSIGAIEAESPHQIPGAKFFYEHVHLKFNGNYVLAASLLPAIQKTLPPVLQAAAVRSLNEKEVTDDLAFTDYERVVYLDILYDSFLKRPPFTNQLNHEQLMLDTKKSIDEQLLHLRQTGLSASKALHEQAVEKRPNDWQILFQYASFLNSGLHDTKAEEVELRKVLKLCPYNSAYLNLAINLHQQAKIKESKSLLNELLEINPNSVEAYMELASIDRQGREYEKEIQHLLKALYLEPEGLISLHINLANAYMNIGNSKKAIEVLDRAIQTFPEENAAQAHVLLSYILYTQHDYEKARQEIRHALKIDPEIQKDPSLETLVKNLGMSGELEIQ